MQWKSYVVAVMLCAIMIPAQCASNNAYDLVKTAARATKSLKHVTEELKDRFYLLSYVLNTTVSYRVYEIGVQLFDLQYDTDDLSEIHDKIFNSISKINLSVQNQVQFCEELIGHVSKLHFDLENNLDDLVIDFSALQTVLATVDLKYWSTVFNITSNIKDIKHVVLEAVNIIENSFEVDDVMKYLQKIEDFLENERIGIEECKYDFDSKSIDLQNFINTLVQYLSPDGY